MQSGWHSIEILDGSIPDRACKPRPGSFRRRAAMIACEGLAVASAARAATTTARKNVLLIASGSGTICWESPEGTRHDLSRTKAARHGGSTAPECLIATGGKGKEYVCS